MSIADKKFSVYVSNYVGNLGTKFLIEGKKNELLKRFPKNYLDKVLSDIDESLEDKGDVMSSFFIYDRIDIKKGGVLTALWDICDKHKLGLKYSLKDIPILQGTIEIANYFDLNPYRLYTDKSEVILIDVDKVVDESMKNTSLKLIGETNKEKQRLRIDGEVDAFLIKDYKDEIDKVIDGRSKR